MDENARASHATHPPTSAYVDGGTGVGDGMSGAFEWAAGVARGTSRASLGNRARIAIDYASEGREGLSPSASAAPVLPEGFPVLASAPEAERLAAEGWTGSHGLLLPNAELAASWAELVRGEPLLDLAGYELESVASREGGCDWKVFMEIYFDDYHVEPFHPGLSSLADCGALRWSWAPHGQVQSVGAGAAMGSGSAAYAELCARSREALGPLDSGAAWAALYPATMVEWLAGGVAISALDPRGGGRCSNAVAFAYPKGMAAARPGLVAAHQRAYWETVLEDDEIAARIQAGREALAMAGRDESGPAHPSLEAGIVKFHDWLALRPWEAPQAKPGRPRGP